MQLKKSSYKVLATDVVDRSTARVVARVTIEGFKDEMKALDKELSKRRLGIVQASARVVSNEHMYKVVSFHVAPLGGEMQDTITNRARMVALSSSGGEANMFMDASDNVWEAQNGRLVRRNHFDNDAMIAKAMSTLASDVSVADRHYAVAAAKNAVGDIAVGNYCCFVDGNVMGDGYIVATDDGVATVLPRPDNVGEPYPAKQVPFGHVVEAFDWNDRVMEAPSVPDYTITAAATLDQSMDYYKKIFGYNPQFWASWQKLMKERVTY